MITINNRLNNNKQSQLKIYLKKFFRFFKNLRDYILIIILINTSLVCFISAIFLLIFLCTSNIFISPEVINSIIISIIALVVSTVSFVYHFITSRMDYPTINLDYKKLFNNNYEIKMSILNNGHGKVQLDYACYFIEQRKPTTLIKNMEFFEFSGKNWKEDQQNLIKYRKNYYKIYKRKMFFSKIDSILKENGVYFSHGETHVVRKLHEFKEPRFYKITFLVLTSKKALTKRVSYFVSNYLNIN